MKEQDSDRPLDTSKKVQCKQKLNLLHIINRGRERTKWDFFIRRKNSQNHFMKILNTSNSILSWRRYENDERMGRIMEER